MTMLHDMLLQERADRLARQKEKRDAAENLHTTTNRSAGSGTQTTLQNKKTTEAPKKTNNTWTYSTHQTIRYTLLFSVHSYGTTCPRKNAITLEPLGLDFFPFFPE
jgi:hypothetical protein